jgi:O-antigen/teichoic acid export membrane protein
MEASAEGGMAARLGAIGESDTGKAAGLAAATMAANVIAVVSTVVFTRMLGADGYGSLAALINLTVILTVPGSALQVAAAREGALGRLGRGPELAATLDRWNRHLGLLLVGVLVVAGLAREPLAALLNVEEEWAAAAVPPAGVLWLLLSVQRGLLQSLHAYKPVAYSIVLEGGFRLVAGAGLVAAGAGVTGAFLATWVAFAGATLVLMVVLRRRLGAPARDTAQHPLRRLALGGAVPIVALTLVAALQNVDVILAKHVLDEDTAGVYAACTVAAKALVWLAVGLGMWVLPEATRRAAEGGDSRPVLLRAFALIGVVAAPALLVYAVAPELLLRLAFGAEYERGSTVLLILGAAYGLLALVYLAVQFRLGLHHRSFTAALAVAALALPLVLSGADDLRTFAWSVLAIFAAAAVAVVTPALWRRPVALPPGEHDVIEAR